MAGWGWASVVCGAALAMAVCLDVFLSVFHLDKTGPIANAVQNLIARPLLFSAKRGGESAAPFWLLSDQSPSSPPLSVGSASSPLPSP